MCCEGVLCTSRLQLLMHTVAHEMVREAEESGGLVCCVRVGGAAGCTLSLQVYHCMSQLSMSLSHNHFFAPSCPPYTYTL